MKKTICACLLLLFVLTGCGAQTPEPKTGAYFLETADLSSVENMSPFLAVDTEQKTFIFLYDMALTTLPFGSYTVEDGVLIATTDTQQTYRFQIQDENTLVFLADGSADVQSTGGDGTTTVTDGSVFRFVETDAGNTSSSSAS